MSLESGLGAAVNFYNSYQGNQRANEEQGWKRRAMKRRDQEWDDEDAIRKEGMDALKKIQEQSFQPIQANDIPMQKVQVPGATASPVDMGAVKSNPAGPVYQEPMTLKDDVQHPYEAPGMAGEPAMERAPVASGNPELKSRVPPALMEIQQKMWAEQDAAQQAESRRMGPGQAPAYSSRAQQVDPGSYGEAGGPMTQGGRVDFTPEQRRGMTENLNAQSPVDPQVRQAYQQAFGGSQQAGDVNGGPAAQQPRAGGAPTAQDPRAGAGPAAQQAGAQPGMERTKTFGDFDRANTVYMAQYNKALELGRPDIALKYHVQGMKLREQMRGKAFDDAQAQYQATGDPNAFVPAFNKYVANGVNVESITKDGEKYRLKGKTDEGKPINQQFTGQQMEAYIRRAQDPATARALEAKRAEELYKAQLEMQKQAQKDRFQSVPAGGSLVDTTNGSSYTNPKETEDKYRPFTVKNADGSESYGSFNERTGGARMLGGSEGASGAAIPKEVRAMQNDARSAVLRANGANDLSGLDPKNQQIVEQQTYIASDLISASHGTSNWSGMSPDRAATIAKAVVTGKAQMAQFRVPGRSEPVRGVVWEGRKYLLDPYHSQPGSSSPASSPMPREKVAPKAQQSRDADRRTLLSEELAAQNERLARAKTDAEKKDAQSAIDSIQRELGVKASGTIKKNG